MSQSTEQTKSSSKQRFWSSTRYAVIGSSGSGKRFPLFTYRGLKAQGRTVYPVDPGAAAVEGDQTYPDLTALPGPVDAAVLEVPRDQTAAWVERVADAGIRNLWIHDGTETPEALAIAERRGLRVETGACAAMYVTPGFTFHSLHRWVNQLLGKY